MATISRRLLPPNRQLQLEVSGQEILTKDKAALKEYVGMYSLDELLKKKEAVSESILKTISVSAEKIGVEVAACGIRDIILPGEVKDIMNQVLDQLKDIFSGENNYVNLGLPCEYCILQGGPF